jgi:transcription antitermination factor NusB
MRKRTRAREIALQALYQHDVGGKRSGKPAAGTCDVEPFIETATGDPEVRQYARRLADGVIASCSELDEKITAVAKNWKLNRIAPVDRCILRLALFEMLEMDEVPPKVAINEAIDLAKKFSTEQSGAFVNGILDRIYNDAAKSEPRLFSPERGS